MFVIIDIYSKNYNSLQIFLKYFFKGNLMKNLKFVILKTQINKPFNKKFFTILKSPHVNKIAQEQFEYKLYKKRIKCFIPQFLLFILVLKKLRFNMFSDINFKINIISNVKKKKKKLKIFLI